MMLFLSQVLTFRFFFATKTSQEFVPWPNRPKKTNALLVSTNAPTAASGILFHPEMSEEMSEGGCQDSLPQPDALPHPHLSLPHSSNLKSRDAKSVKLAEDKQQPGRGRIQLSEMVSNQRSQGVLAIK